MSARSGAGRREVAYRLFAAEFDDADLSHTEGDEERAPNYVIAPTGARINRLFAVGVLTEVEHVNEEMVRARVVDPTGAFVVYAGQYQPDALAFLERADPPMFVAGTGKARTFQPEDSDRVFTSVRPESVNEVDAETRDRWTVGAAEHTLDRVSTFAEALDMERRGDDLREALVSNGVDDGLAAGIALAIDHYGTTPAYLEAIREMAVDALRLVAGERDGVEPPQLAPDEGGHADLDALKAPSAPGEEPTAEGVAGYESEEQRPGGLDADSGSAGVGTASGTPAASAADGSGGGPAEPAGESDDAVPTADPVAAGEEPTTADRPDVASRSPEEGASEADTPSDAAGEGGEDIGDFDPGEFDLEDDERDRIESEYGTEFETGTEVDEPGEADIAAAEPADDVEGEAGTEAEEAPDGAVDLEDAAVDAMRDLDEGEGADRDAVVERVAERSGASRDDVTAAIRDALMDGRCYEPDDETLKPI